jgi:hypothetical protein
MTRHELRVDPPGLFREIGLRHERMLKTALAEIARHSGTLSASGKRFVPCAAPD